MRVISPVFGKELTQFASSRKAFVIKCVYLTGFLIAVALVLADNNSPYGRARLGNELCEAMALCSVLAAFLIVPFMAVGTVYEEDRANTLSLLFLTQLTPFNIAQDKALARVLQAGYVVMLSIPVFACGLLFGGVSWLQVGASIIYVIGSILMAAAIAIVISAHVRNFPAALVVCFVTELVFLMGSILFVDAMRGSDDWLFYVNPIAVLGVYHSGEDYMEGCLTFLGLSSMTYVVAVALASNRIAMLKRDPSAIPSFVRKFRRCVSDRLGGGQCPEQSCDRPVYWRDRYVAPDLLFKMSRWILWAILVWGGFMFILYLFKGGYHRNSYAIMVTIPGSLIALGVMTIMGASTIAMERSKGTLPILLSTEMSQGHLVRGYLQVVASFFLDATVVVFAICGFNAVLDKMRYSYYPSSSGWHVGSWDLRGLCAFLTFASALVLLYWLVRIVIPFKPLSFERRRLTWYWVRLVVLCSGAATVLLAMDQISLMLFVWPFFAMFAIALSLVISLNSGSLGRALGWAFGIMASISTFPIVFTIFTNDEEWLPLSPAAWLILGVVDELDELDDTLSWTILVVLGFTVAIIAMIAYVESNFNRVTGRQE
jgi:hypothetical protein